MCTVTRDPLQKIQYVCSDFLGMGKWCKPERLHLVLGALVFVKNSSLTKSSMDTVYNSNTGAWEVADTENTFFRNSQSWREILCISPELNGSIRLRTSAWHFFWISVLKKRNIFHAYISGDFPLCMSLHPCVKGGSFWGSNILKQTQTQTSLNE